MGLTINYKLSVDENLSVTVIRELALIEKLGFGNGTA